MDAVEDVVEGSEARVPADVATELDADRHRRGADEQPAHFVSDRIVEQQ